MDFQSHAHPAQARSFVCTGCGAWAGGPGAMTVRSPVGGFTGYACRRCYDRASRDARFCAQFECAVGAGLPLRELQRNFAALGVFDVPITPEECDEALGLRPGTAAHVGGGAL